MRIGVTGSNGFLGWHLRVRLRAAGHEVIAADRSTCATPASLDAFVRGCEAIIHAAGVNRAASDSELVAGNLQAADVLIASLRRTETAVPLVYTNSVQSTGDTPYGTAKRDAGTRLGEYQQAVGAPMLNLRLPHVFGEFGRPNYNSAVTTFASSLATDVVPDINRDGRLELVHAQDVAERCREFCVSSVGGDDQMAGIERTVGQVWDLLAAQHHRYVQHSTIPAFESLFDQRIFNVLRSQLYAAGHYPQRLTLHRDGRGGFMEACRADGLGQTSVSSTEPGVTRGDHFHFDKIERFVVINGDARIALRRLLTEDTQIFDVSGDEPVFIDMPPLTTHSITNTGSDTMVTLFWAGDHFDPQSPDTHAEPVSLTPGTTNGAAS